MRWVGRCFALGDVGQENLWRWEEVSSPLPMGLSHGAPCQRWDKWQQRCSGDWLLGWTGSPILHPVSSNMVRCHFLLALSEQPLPPRFLVPFPPHRPPPSSPGPVLQVSGQWLVLWTAFPTPGWLLLLCGPLLPHPTGLDCHCLSDCPSKILSSECGGLQHRVWCSVDIQ